MHSSADQRTLRFADGSVVPLPDPGRWQYRVTPGMYGAPHAPWETIVGLGSIYNGMIAPIGLYTLRGVAWYQGEADGEFPAGYAGRLSSMMAGWRAQFGDPALPFLIVQLPNWGPRNAVPIESGFASVRDEQRRAVLADPHAALAVTIDLGDVVNLHPLNKQDVGHRLSRAATALVYGGAMPSNGPLGVRAKHVAGGFGIAFQGVDQAMAAYNGAPLGFELCGSAAGTCRFAPARFAGGSHVVVADDGQPATRIRYCWGESPVCNLSDASGIPAAPFELAIQ
jgi:sialate O-acetylesterase